MLVSLKWGFFDSEGGSVIMGPSFSMELSFIEAGEIKALIERAGDTASNVDTALSH